MKYTLTHTNAHTNKRVLTDAFKTMVIDILNEYDKDVYISHIHWDFKFVTTCVCKMVYGNITDILPFELEMDKESEFILMNCIKQGLQELNFDYYVSYSSVQFTR